LPPDVDELFDDSKTLWFPLPRVLSSSYNTSLYFTDHALIAACWIIHEMFEGASLSYYRWLVRKRYGYHCQVFQVQCCLHRTILVSILLISSAKFIVHCILCFLFPIKALCTIFHLSPLSASIKFIFCFIDLKKESIEENFKCAL
jgi:hypothetical protein